MRIKTFALTASLLGISLLSRAQQEVVPAQLMATLDSLTVLLEESCNKNYTCADLSEEGQGHNPFTPGSEIQRRMNTMEFEIPMEYNQHVQSFIDLYGIKKKALTSRILTLSQYYFPKFEEILLREGLPPEFKYLAVVESALNPKALSWAGASGLWQFIHSTGVMYGLKINSYIDERRDPEKATLAACEYFKNSYELYGDWLLVIASYNCGPGNVNKAIRKAGGKKNFWAIQKYLPRETRGYVPAFIAVAYVMNHYEDYKITPTPVDLHRIVEDVQVDDMLHFEQIAQALDISLDELSYLNPAYKKGVIPAKDQSLSLTLPYLKAMQFVELGESIYSTPLVEEDSNGLKYTYQISTEKINYTVRKGESLKSIARKFNCSVTELKEWNIIRGSTISPGRKLVVYNDIKTRIPLDRNEASDSAALLASAATAEKTDTTPAPSVQDKKAEDKKIEIALYHEVMQGDTLYSISRKYEGLTVEKLRKLNNLAETDVIKPGTRLKVGTGS